MICEEVFSWEETPWQKEKNIYCKSVSCTWRLQRSVLECSGRIWGSWAVADTRATRYRRAGKVSSWMERRIPFETSKNLNNRRITWYGHSTRNPNHRRKSLWPCLSRPSCRPLHSQADKYRLLYPRKKHEPLGVGSCVSDTGLETGVADMGAEGGLHTMRTDSLTIIREDYERGG